MLIEGPNVLTSDGRKVIDRFVEEPDAELTAPPSIGLVFRSSRMLRPGMMSQGTRHRGLFLQPLTTDMQVTEFMLNVSAATQEGGSRLCMKVPIGHGVTLKHLQSVRVRWRDVPASLATPVIRCEGVVPVEDHSLVAGFAYFGSVLHDRVPYTETVAGEHQHWLTARDKIERQQVNLTSVEVLTDPKRQDLEDIARIYAESFDAYLCNLSDLDAIREMVTSSLTVIVREEGRIVAIAIAEHMPMAFDGHAKINFVEISDVAVSSLARSSGYAKAMYQRLLELCIERYTRRGEKVVITTETRAICPQLYTIMARCGFSNVGFLPSHCEIKHDATADTALQQRNGYGDLAIFVYDPDNRVVDSQQHCWWGVYK